MGLDDAIQEYIEKKVPFDKLALVVPRDFNSKLIEQYSETIDEDDEEPDNEFFRTKFGLLRLIRSSFVPGPTLIDTVTIIKCKDDKISYR